MVGELGCQLVGGIIAMEVSHLTLDPVTSLLLPEMTSWRKRRINDPEATALVAYGCQNLNELPEHHSLILHPAAFEKPGAAPWSVPPVEDEHEVLALEVKVLHELDSVRLEARY